MSGNTMPIRGLIAVIVGMIAVAAMSLWLGGKMRTQIELQPIVLPVFRVEVVEKKIELPTPGVPGACRLIDRTESMRSTTRSYDCNDYLLFYTNGYYKLCDKKGNSCRTI